MEPSALMGSIPIPTTNIKHIIKMANKPIYSKRVSAKTRVYYVDACKDSKGEYYLCISEIPTDSHPGKKKRQRVFIHSQNIDKLMVALADISTLIKNDSQR